jgi:hypothetical protein
MAHAEHGAVHYPQPSREAWASGLELFGAIMMIVIGLFHIVVGLAAILQSAFYVMVFTSGIAAWAWLHLILGLLVALTGLALLAGRSQARVVGMVLLALSALGAFLFMPYQPVWSILIIFIDVAVLWALAVRQRELPSLGSRSEQHE